MKRVTGVLIVVIVAAAAPAVLSSYALTVAALLGLYATAALAQNVLSGYAAVPSLGNVVFFATGAYTCGSLIVIERAPAGVAMVAGVMAAGLASLIIGLPSLRVSGMHLAVVTVASVFVARELMDSWDASHVPISGGVSASAPGWLLNERPLYWMALLVAGIAFLAVWNLLRTRSGRALIALSASPAAAEAAGIPVVYYRFTAFVLSGMLTGMAGVGYLYYAHTVTPATFSLDLSLAFLTMIIVGGTSSLPGSLLGAAIIALLPEGLRLLPADIHGLSLTSSVNAMWAVLLLVTLWFFPEGIWNGMSGILAREETLSDEAEGIRLR